MNQQRVMEDGLNPQISRKKKDVSDKPIGYNC